MSVYGVPGVVTNAPMGLREMVLTPVIVKLLALHQVVVAAAGGCHGTNLEGQTGAVERQVGKHAQGAGGGQRTGRKYAAALTVTLPRLVPLPKHGGAGSNHQVAEHRVGRVQVQGLPRCQVETVAVHIQRAGVLTMMFVETRLPLWSHDPAGIDRRRPGVIVGHCEPPELLLPLWSGCGPADGPGGGGPPSHWIPATTRQG